MGNQTPETIRAAAYLATRERLDARKTTRNVQCNPPNIRCGNRCIPPTWDCRLKGQGTDPHLRAVKTDPLGGLANIQRGFGRISRGIVKGNFSEVEGGKRAIIRGTVKIAPGNLQQKKELQKKLENRTRAIGIGLAVVTGGLGIHALLMKSNTFGYKYGLGKQINESVHAGVSRVLDATPLLGAQRARTRVGAFSSISEAVTRSARAPQAGPDGLVAGLNSNSPQTLRNLQNLNIGDTNRNASSNLAAATRAVNQSTRDSNSTNVYAWNEKHREAFWGAKVGAPDLDSFIAKETAGRIAKANISSFARPAAEDYLVKQYNLPIENGGSNAGVTAIKAALANKLIEEREMHVAYAKQLGLRTASKNKEEVIHPDDVNSYLLRLNKSAGITGSGTASRIVKDNADAHIAKLMEGKSLKERADNIYAEAVFGFDKLYSEVASKVKTVPGAASLSDTRKVAPAIPEGTQSLLASLDRVRVGDMARELQLSRSQIAGEAHAELVRSAYFANRVARSDKTNRATFAITDRVAQNAASELAGRPITQPAEAFRLLQSEYGFSGATRVQSARSSTTTASAPAARTPRSGLGRQAAISSLAREIRARAGNEGMSLEAAYRAAKREIEQRGDSRPELVRTATYLAARADFQEGKRLGKPCGASHIPKAHECRKGQGGSAPPESDTSEKQRKGTSTSAKVAVAAGIAAIGVVGVTIAFDVNRLNKGSGMPEPPSFRQVVSALKKEDKTLTTETALLKHYDDVAAKEGWKVGQLVYTRYNDKSAVLGKKNDHFAVYMGKRAGGHMFASFGFDPNVEGGGYASTVTIGNSGGKPAPFIYSAVPKTSNNAPPRYSEDQIKARVVHSLNQRMKYDVVENNCEAWARLITEGQPRSEQAARVTRLSRFLFKTIDGIGSPALKGHTTLVQEAKRLDLEWRRMQGDAAAVAELDAFHELVRQGRRTDADEHISAYLLSANELLPEGVTELEARHRVRMYLMLLVRVAESAQRGRTDSFRAVQRAARHTKGKPCGESYIPKSHECDKTKGNTAVKAAIAVAGVAAGAYALNKAQLNQFHTGLAINDITPPFRKRRFGWMEQHQKAMTSDQISSVFDGLKAHNEVVPDNVQRLQDFVKRNNIKSDPKQFLNDLEAGFKEFRTPSELRTLMVPIKMQARLGMLDGLASATSNNVFVRSTRKQVSALNANTAAMIKTTARFMDRRAAQVDSPKPSLTEGFRQLFNVARNTRDGDTSEALTFIHEIAHKAHWQATLKIGASTADIVNGAVYDPVRKLTAAAQSPLINQLKAASSEYGRTDVDTNRVETFAELSTLYMTQGVRFKRDFPLAYAWVDDIWRTALD